MEGSEITLYLGTTKCKKSTVQEWGKRDFFQAEKMGMRVE